MLKTTGKCEWADSLAVVATDHRERRGRDRVLLLYKIKSMVDKMEEIQEGLPKSCIA